MPNVIILMNDTLRRDHVSAYGLPAPWERPGHDGEPFIQTPNLDRLAVESAVFDRFYCASYPTIPCRYDCFTGRFGFPTRGWQPLEPDDVVMSEIVRSAGHVPVLIYDTPMLGNDSYNYTRGFVAYDFVRGQHADRYNVDPTDPPLPAAAYKLKSIAATKLYLRNNSTRRGEADWMCVKTVAAAMDWLERNRTRDNFVLWVDMWDPHEPFDAPDFDTARYADPSFDGDRVIYPKYGRADYLSDGERNHVRAMYAGLVTCVDRWVGRLLEKVEAVGLDRNTLVVHLTDHGHLFGDHGLQGKPTGPFGQLYEVTARVPLMIRHPNGLGAGTKVAGLAQHPDLLPTILEFLGIAPPEEVQGSSLWPLIDGRAERIREYAFSGRYSRSLAGERDDAAAFDGWAGGDQGGEPITVTSEAWSYLYTPAGGIRELYDLRTDPEQRRNVAGEHPDMVGRMHGGFVDFLRSCGAPDDRVRAYTDPKPRLGIQPDARLYVLRDAAKRAYAFTSERDARQTFPGVAAEPIPFGALADQEPRALVYIHEQYYWADDLR